MSCWSYLALPAEFDMDVIKLLSKFSIALYLMSTTSWISYSTLVPSANGLQVRWPGHFLSSRSQDVEAAGGPGEQSLAPWKSMCRYQQLTPRNPTSSLPRGSQPPLCAWVGRFACSDVCRSAFSHLKSSVVISFVVTIATVILTLWYFQRVLIL